MITRETIDWFVDRALEYQDLKQDDYRHDFRFEIGTRGITVTIWSRDEDENGMCAYFYESKPTATSYTIGWNQNIRDPHLRQAREHVEKIIREARDEANI